MPGAIIGAIAAEAIGTAIGGEVIFGTLTSGGLIGKAAGFVIGGVVSSALASKPEQPQQTADPVLQSEGRLVNVRQPTAPWQVIYGRARVGGVITYIEATPGDTFDNGLLNLVITLAGHEVDAVESIWFDDEQIPLDGTTANGGGDATGRLAGYCAVEIALGSESGQPFPGLVTYSQGKWTADHRQDGRAKIYVRLRFNPDLYPNGVPNITAVVRGKPVYDPRTATTTYSANAALCVNDYLTSTAFGFGATYASEIDETALIAAANICDEDVSLAAGGTEARYTVNGAFLTSAAPKRTLELLLSAMGGKAVNVGGKWFIYTGAYDSPTIELDESDLAGPIRVQSLISRRENANGVKGIFTDPNSFWQPTDFPAIASTTYLSEDGGERVWRDLDLSTFVTSGTQAQRLAKIDLLSVRQGLTVVLPCKLTAWAAVTGRTVAVTNTKFGWSSKAFDVQSSRFTVADDGTLGVELSLRETASAVFDWSTSEEQAVDIAPNSNLPDPFTVAAPTNVAAASGTDQLLAGSDGTITTRVRLAWDTAGDAFVTSGGKVLLQFKPSSADTWIDAPPIDGASTEAWILGVEDGVAYDLRVRFQNTIGVRSDWTQISHTVVGKTALPSDVALFTIEGTRLTWTPVSDADVAGYRLKFQFGVNRSWGDANALHNGLVTESPFDLQIVPSGATTLMLKAVDTSGNESENPAVILWNFGDAIVANVVETFDLKAAGFVGTKTNGTVSGGNLVADVLASPLMWNADDAADFWSWDSAQLIWSTTMYKQMTYVDSVTITQALSGSRLTIAATVAGDPWSIEYRENSQKAMWDADATSLMWAADSSTLMWDDPAWITWPGAIEVTDTIIDLRVTTGQATTQGEISELVVTVDAPDIVENLNDVSILAAGTRLAITAGFSVIKNVQLTVQNDGGSAITARTEDKSATLGPLIKCLDAAGSATTGLVDARVQGY